MTATVEIPDDLARLVWGSHSSPSRAVLEAVAADAYRQGHVTMLQVRTLLGHASQWETRDFLASRHALPESSADEILRDVEAAAPFFR
jgi:Uncharacterised protein family (UPF0175)